MKAYKEIIGKDSKEEIEDIEVRAELDRIFEEGERDSLKGLGVPARAFMEETMARLFKEIIEHEDLDDPKVRAQMDEIFGPGWQKALEDGVPIRMYTEKTGRLSE